MTGNGFGGRDYKPDSPLTYVSRLISENDPDGITLAKYIKHIEHNGQVLGDCIEVTPNRAVQLWVISGRSHHLIYGFVRERREVWYLIAFNGNVADHLQEARTRLSNMRR